VFHHVDHKLRFICGKSSSYETKLSCEEKQPAVGNGSQWSIEPKCATVCLLSILLCAIAFSYYRGLLSIWFVFCFIMSQRLFNCTVCGRGFKRKYHLERHMLSHSDFKPYTCELCGQGYKRKEKLDRHSLKHLGNMSFACPNCQQRFSSHQGLQEHMTTHIKQETGTAALALAAAGGAALVRVSTANMPANISTASTSSEEERISLLSRCCDVCGKVFAKKDHLSRHKAIHSDVRAFKCHLCDMAFKRKDKLTSHLNTHGVSHLVQCNLCGKHFQHEQSLNLHMRKVHLTPMDSAAIRGQLQRAAGKNPLVCDLCFSGFTRKYHLDRHRAASHGGLKPHICPECGQGFTRKDHMERHMLTHLGLKPFACTHLGCDKTFRRKETLSVHLATHQSNGKPPFPCLYCERRFATPKSRSAHMQKHVEGARSVMEIIVEEC
jgi:KRAB domain-containing zinc finger protein